MRLNKLTGLVLLCLAFFSSGLVAQENKFSLSSYGDDFSTKPDKFFYYNELEGVLFLNGEIEKGMYTNFRQAITENKIHTIVLNSFGGNVDEGLDIATTVFDKGIKTYVPKENECYSACSFIFFAGSEKYTLGKLGVHQVGYADDVAKLKFEVGEVTSISQLTTADILLRLGEFNTPRFVEQRMLRTKKMYIFNTKELNKLGNLDVSTTSKILFKKIDQFIEDLNNHNAEQSCNIDATKCSPIQLCSRAASNKSWITTIEAENYVKVAKGKGLSCGVPVPICPEDIEKCNKEYLCTYGTTGLDSNLSWLNNSFADEAKLRGYSCGIAVKPEIKKQICSQNAELCSDNELCSWAIRKQTDSVRFWSKLSKFYDFVQEAKRRGLSCGVKKETPAVKNKTCFSDPKLCNDNLLCNNAVEGTVNNPRWGRKPYFGKYVTEAKRRGLSCGVKKKKPIKNEMVRSIQKQLNRLGCNAGTADGILGRKTLSALKRWKYAGGNYTPNKIDQRLRSSLFESPYKCSSAQTSSTIQAKPGLLSGTWDVIYSRCDNKRYRSILSLYSSKSNEYEAIYNVQNRIYKGKLKIAGDKYSISLKGPGGLVSGNGILNKTYTRAQGRDHMGCLFDATKR